MFLKTILPNIHLWTRIRNYIDKKKVKTNYFGLTATRTNYIFVTIDEINPEP